MQDHGLWNGRRTGGSRRRLGLLVLRQSEPSPDFRPLFGCTLASHLSRCTHSGWCEIASPRSRRGLCCQRYAPTCDTFSDSPLEIRVLSHVGIADAYRDAGALGGDGSADQ
jgi:hypothetical protein